MMKPDFLILMADDDGEHYLFVNDMIRRQTGDHPETVLQYGLVNAGHNLPVFPLTNR